MRVTGLDLSLTGTGVANLRPNEPTVGLLRLSSAPAGDGWPDRFARIQELSDQIVEAVAAGGAPRLVVLEAPAYGSRTGHVHDRAGLWWSAYRRVSRQCAVVVVPPTVRAKYATGRGNAGKDEVLAAVVRRYPWAEVENNDHADALVLAAMGARWLGEPVEESLPKAAVEAVGRVEWPDVY